MSYRVVSNIVSDVSAIANEASEIAREHGSRSLLNSSFFTTLAAQLRLHPEVNHLLNNLSAVQCIYFEKTKTKNWKVPLHQDKILPIQGQGPWKSAGIKEGVEFHHAPSELLDRCVVIRLSLDEVPEGDLNIVEHNGVSIADSESVYVPKGGALVMKPSTYHGSVKLAESKQRRVIHFLFGPKSLPELYEWRWVA
tara:strand:- start:164 stop:748 length:585 start_codon:yes stop_codon:yes gene_type:complete